MEKKVGAILFTSDSILKFLTKILKDNRDKSN